MKSDIKYDKALVNKLFHKTLEKGISSSYIVQEIKECLRKGVSDETLIAAVTKPAASEKERIAVQSKARKKVFEVSAENDQFSKLLSAVESLTKQVSSLQTDVNIMKQGNVQFKGVYRCDDCKKNNVDKCNHCYKCGAADHRGRYCRKSKDGQGN